VGISLEEGLAESEVAVVSQPKELCAESDAVR